MTRRLGTSLFLMIMLLLFASVCHAESPSLMTRHVRDVVRDGQAPLVGRLPATQTMRLALVLPLRNQAQLTSLLNELYTPSAPRYRQWLTVDEFTTMFGPTEQDYSTVLNWAASNGFTVVDTSRNRVNRPST